MSKYGRRCYFEVIDSDPVLDSSDMNMYDVRFPLHGHDTRGRIMHRVLSTVTCTVTHPNFAIHSVLQWCKIAKDIEKAYKDWDGFVILHGTDTMAYTTSALSFMLKNLGKTVIPICRQLPFCF